jgi:hypothetical protein
MRALMGAVWDKVGGIEKRFSSMAFATRASANWPAKTFHST